MRAWLVMAVAAMMQSPMGMSLCWHLMRPACLAMVGVKFWICSPLSMSAW